MIFRKIKVTENNLEELYKKYPDEIKLLYYNIFGDENI